MRTAIFGGTFDPIHIGHLVMADEVLARLDYDEVRFVPAGMAPHKRDAPGASSDDRLEMIRLATAERSEFAVDPFELQQGGVSYTVRTLRHMIEDGLVSGRPGLIIGEDLVEGFERWREADEVVRLADLILVRRPVSGRPEFPWPHTEVENLTLNISSSDIRERVRIGLPYRYLVTPDVYGYIRDNSLYRVYTQDGNA